MKSATTFRAKRLFDHRSCRSGVPAATGSRFATSCSRTSFQRGRGGFTLVEALAAMMFMAIVIPAAIEGLHVASTAGEVAAAKVEAARIAERALNENIVTGTWNQSLRNGTVEENDREFRWTLRNTPWTDNAMRLLTAEVTFPVQERQYSVRLSTLVNVPQ